MTPLQSKAARVLERLNLRSYAESKDPSQIQMTTARYSRVPMRIPRIPKHPDSNGRRLRGFPCIVNIMANDDSAARGMESDS